MIRMNKVNNEMEQKSRQVMEEWNEKQAKRAEQRKCSSRQQKSTDLQMKHAAIRDRLKLSSLKNKTLLRHPNYHLLQTADSSPKCTPRCCWPLYAARVYCRLLFNFFLPTRSSRWFLAELLPSCQLPGCTNRWSYSSPSQGFALPFVELCEVPVSPLPQTW